MPANFPMPTISHPKANVTIVTVGSLELSFSYTTCVSMLDLDTGKRTTRENVWGTTTGKHLNYLDGGDKASRVSAEEFARALAKVVVR